MEIQNCKYCNVINAEAPFELFNDNDVERVLKGIYSGTIAIDSLDAQTYHSIAEKLTEGAFEGFGKSLMDVEFGTPDFQMLNSIRENVYVFSAAKTYQQTKEISSLIRNGNELRTFSEFKKEAVKVFDRYNKHYLKAEYNSAVGQARSCSMWMDIESEKELYNQLQYETVGDSRVRPEHKVLDRIIRPVDDKFWDLYMPPNGWNCRCTVLQTEGEQDTDLSTKQPPTKKEVPEIFRFNPGKTKQIFSPKHPYFDVPAKDKPLAKKNFKLPLPGQVKSIAKGFVPAKNVKEAEIRIMNANVKSCSLKGLNTEMANAVLEAVETENSFGNFSLEKLDTFRRKNSQARAWYKHQPNHISINVAHIKANKQILKSYEEQLIDLKATIEKVKSEYLGKPQYSQSTVFARINAVRSRIGDIERRIARGEQAKYFTVLSKYESDYDALRLTIVHELGHNRHYKTLKETYNFSFHPSRAVSEYGKTNAKEFFAEWFTHYRTEGENGVPEDLLKLFKQIDNGKLQMP